MGLSTGGNARVPRAVVMCCVLPMVLELFFLISRMSKKHHTPISKRKFVEGISPTKDNVISYLW